jgi:hypothetical protein
MSSEDNTSVNGSEPDVKPKVIHVKRIAISPDVENYEFCEDTYLPPINGTNHGVND